MDFYKAIDNGNSDGKRQIEFINPTTLERNIFLHVQMVISTSPYENAIVFVKNTPSITSVTVSPLELTTSAGQTVKLNATVVPETGNILFETSNPDIVTVTQDGTVTGIKEGTATITVTVTAENGTKSTYKINATRKDDRSKNNNLSSLSVSNTNIQFNGGQVYTATVENGVTQYKASSKINCSW